VHYQAVVDSKKRFLRLTFAEDATIEDWRESLFTLLHLSQETGFRHVLVDVRQQKASGDVVDLFRFGASIPVRIACAVMTQPGRTDHELVETIALNRGVTAKLFSGSEEDAIRWLESA